MTRLKIKVTQEFIDKGERGDRGSCPIAFGIEATKPPKRPGQTDDASLLIPRVNALQASFYYAAKGCPVGANLCEHGYYVKVALPTRATRFVKRFDKLGKHAVKPFAFFINIPMGAL